MPYKKFNKNNTYTGVRQLNTSTGETLRSSHLMAENSNSSVSNNARAPRLSKGATTHEEAHGCIVGIVFNSKQSQLIFSSNLLPVFVHLLYDKKSSHYMVHVFLLMKSIIKFLLPTCYKMTPVVCFTLRFTLIPITAWPLSCRSLSMSTGLDRICANFPAEKSCRGLNWCRNKKKSKFSWLGRAQGCQYKIRVVFS